MDFTRGGRLCGSYTDKIFLVLSGNAVVNSSFLTAIFRFQN